MESSAQIQEKDKKNKQEVQKEVKPAIAPVSYTHLTLPTKRIV